MQEGALIRSMMGVFLVFLMGMSMLGGLPASVDRLDACTAVDQHLKGNRSLTDASVSHVSGVTGTFTDDFSADTGKWTYVGSAYRDVATENVVLTRNQAWQAGIAWLNEDVLGPFTAEFRYKAGGGTGADGFVLMFYKQRDYTPGSGGHLGFCVRVSGSVAGPIPGYGIEFDNFYNSEWKDPSHNHIALIKDTVGNHLASVNDARTEDYTWHHVKVIVGEASVTVAVDGIEVLTWEGQLDRTFGGFGFSGSTGAYHNWHIIDDVKITVSPLDNEPFLHFPLSGKTPWNATINAVFDHSMSSPYSADGVVVAYTGEEAKKEFGERQIAGTSFYGYRNAEGTTFTVNGNYTGGDYLYYDGHPGYDFRTTDQGSDVPVLAAASGTAYRGSSEWGVVYIDHGNGYRTEYWHLVNASRIADNTAVTQGQQIGIAGNTGGGGVHLHFELRKDIDGQWVSVDPYGWHGPGVDPYFIKTGVENVNLWLEPAPLMVGQVVLSEPLQLTLASPYFVGETLTATFVVENRGNAAITLDQLLLGGRYNEGELPGGAYPDFTYETVALLQPGQSHQYEGTFTIPEPGEYDFFVAYQIENPTEAEKEFLDDNNWNTSIELGESLTDADRTRHIVAEMPPYSPYPYGYSFRNSSAQGLSTASKWAVFRSTFDLTGLDTRTQERWVNHLKFGEGGNCYGMAAASVMEYRYPHYDLFLEAHGVSHMFHLGPPNWRPAETGWGGGWPIPNIAEKPLLKQIVEFQISQTGIPRGQRIVGTKPVLDTLLTQFPAEMYVLSIFDERYGHALVPYAIETVTTDEKYLIYVYDSNWPDKADRAVEVEWSWPRWHWEYELDTGRVWSGPSWLGVFGDRSINLIPASVMYNDGERLRLSGRPPRVFLEGEADLLLMDSESNIAGLIGDTFHEEVPGIELIFEVGVALDEPATRWQPAFSIIPDEAPGGAELTYVIRGLSNPGDYSMVKLGDGYSFGISGSIGLGEETEVTMSDDVTAMTISGHPDGYTIDAHRVVGDSIISFAAMDVSSSNHSVHQFIIDWDALAQGEPGITIDKDHDGDGVVDETITTGVPETPTDPSPAEKATGVSLHAALSWTCDDSGSVTYNVYVGTTMDPPLVSERQAGTTYSPELEFGTQYYWKAVAINEHSIARSSPLWSFTTEGHWLTVSSTAGGSVVSPGEGSFAYGFGETVDLVAEPDEGYRFVNWTGDIDSIVNVNAASTTITMNDDYSITASFEEMEHWYCEWTEDGVIHDDEILEAVYCWLTGTPKNDHLLTDEDILWLVYCWLTGEVTPYPD